MRVRTLRSYLGDPPMRFAMVDGSVHFVNEDIDLQVYRDLASINGQETSGGLSGQ